MSTDDLRRIAVAAADKESAAFELDYADLNLKEALVTAWEHGTPLEIIAEVADLEPEDVLDVVHGAEELVLPTPDERDRAPAHEAAPTMLPPIAQDAG